MNMIAMRLEKPIPVETAHNYDGFLLLSVRLAHYLPPEPRRARIQVDTCIG
jgi:hypothetical protein